MRIAHVPRRGASEHDCKLHEGPREKIDFTHSDLAGGKALAINYNGIKLSPELGCITGSEPLELWHSIAFWPAVRLLLG